MPKYDLDYLSEVYEAYILQSTEICRAPVNRWGRLFPDQLIAKDENLLCLTRTPSPWRRYASVFSASPRPASASANKGTQYLSNYGSLMTEANTEGGIKFQVCHRPF